jgi:hypothetical protein
MAGREKRKMVALNPETGVLLEERLPNDITRSEFVRQLLEQQPVEKTIVVELDDVQQVVRDELDLFAGRLLDRLEERLRSIN